MIDVLSHAAAFEGLARDDLVAIDAALCSPMTFIAGDEVFTPDSRDDPDLYLLYAGHLETTAADGRVIGQVLNGEAPELMGEIAWLTGRRRSVTQVCATDVEAVRIDGAGLRDWLDANPRACARFMRNVAVGLATRLLDKEVLLGATSPC